jgi:RNA polymerase sigma-70 factor, ECF subfamily
VGIEPTFDELYQREFPVVFRAAYALCGDAVAAEDATQEAFARALARWRRLRKEPWAAGWVTTTALNVLKRQLRRSGPVSGAEEDGAEENHEAESLDLWAAIRLLPERQREAVVLHYVVDLSIAESAAAMRCEEGTVKAHLSRARQALRHLLEGARDGT